MAARPRPGTTVTIRVYWVTPDEGEPYLTDRHGRSVVEVKGELALALDLSGRLVVILSEVETLTPIACSASDVPAAAAVDRDAASGG